MTITAGLTHELEFLVDESMTADRMGNPAARVFSTPSLVQCCETAAIQLVGAHLQSGQGTVGTSLHIQHLAATPVGVKVRIHAELVEADGRRLLFRIRAWDEKEAIGEGTHERFLVDMEKFLARAEAKATEHSHAKVSES